MDFGSSEASLVSGTCNEIPYSNEQGIFAADAGKLRSHGPQAGYFCIFVFLHYRRQTAASMIEIDRLVPQP